MDVIICKTSADAEKLAARMIADAINAKPEFKLGLATGATMENVYAELSRLNKAGEVDFSQVRSWNLDEYAGLCYVDYALNRERIYIVCTSFDILTVYQYDFETEEVVLIDWMNKRDILITQSLNVYVF